MYISACSLIWVVHCHAGGQAVLHIILSPMFKHPNKLATTRSYEAWLATGHYWQCSCSHTARKRFSRHCKFSQTTHVYCVALEDWGVCTDSRRMMKGSSLTNTVPKHGNLPFVYEAWTCLNETYVCNIPRVRSKKSDLYTRTKYKFQPHLLKLILLIWNLAKVNDRWEPALCIWLGSLVSPCNLYICTHF